MAAMSPCQHLDDMKESYFEHMGKAFGFGTETCFSGCIFFLHGLLPCCCTKIVTSNVIDLGRRLEARVAAVQKVPRS
jgi:hypothetical protein